MAESAGVDREEGATMSGVTQKGRGSFREQCAREEACFREAVRAHYEVRAPLYDQDRDLLDPHDCWNFDVVLPHLLRQSGSRILEVAAGTGLILEQLLAAGKDAYGLDLTVAQLKEARTKPGIPADRLVCADAEHLPFTDGRFDAVCIFRALHHVNRPERVIDEMIRCTRRDLFIYDSTGGRRRLVKRALSTIGLYQPLYYLRNGRWDTGYRSPSVTDGPIRVFYAEDGVPLLQRRGLRIRGILKTPLRWFIHATKEKECA
jgi:SAM-dependent methyltransferase